MSFREKTIKRTGEERVHSRDRECRARETAARARREDRSMPSTLYLYYRNDSTVSTVFAYVLVLLKKALSLLFLLRDLSVIGHVAPERDFLRFLRFHFRERW